MRTVRHNQGGCGRRHGQVLIITVLSLTLLSGLVFYVYNVGHQVNRRLVVQHAADAAAVSGATWMARCMNTVAMNNVAQSRMLASVLVLDSIPLATQMSYDETTAWELCLANQLGRGVPGGQEGQFIRSGLEALRARMATQRDILQPVNALFNQGNFHVEDYTTWSVQGAGGAPPHGKFWQAAVALDQLSQATVLSAGVLAQTSAVQFGKTDYAKSAMMVPIAPKVPAVRGTFENFGPVLQGRVQVNTSSATFAPTGGRGGAIPEMANPFYPYSLGPWARLYRWRDYTYLSTGGTWVSDTQVRGGGDGFGGRSVGASAITQAQGHSVGGSSILTGYTAYGPYSWALRQIWNWAGPWGTWNDQGQLADTFFSQYVSQISRIKLGYMFGAKDPLKTIHYPLWKTNYPEARTLATDGRTRVTRTMFYLVEIASSVPEGSAGWLSAGTYRVNAPPPDDKRHEPISRMFRGWWDPELPNKQMSKVADYIWKRSLPTADYWTTSDPEIGIQPKNDATGQPVFQPVYVCRFYIFGGIDVGGDMPVTNPCNWSSTTGLPAPLLLDMTKGDYGDPATSNHDVGMRRDTFSYLGIASHEDKPPAWSSQFSTANPAKMMVALAQAEVFNNTSWDLWTQDWQAQLVPVSQWSDWMQRIDQSSADLGAAGNPVQPADFNAIVDYLKKIDPDLVDTYIKH